MGGAAQGQRRAATRTELPGPWLRLRTLHPKAHSGHGPLGHSKSLRARRGVHREVTGREATCLVQHVKGGGTRGMRPINCSFLCSPLSLTDSSCPASHPSQACGIPDQEGESYAGQGIDSKPETPFPTTPRGSSITCATSIRSTFLQVLFSPCTGSSPVPYA